MSANTPTPMAITEPTHDANTDDLPELLGKPVAISPVRSSAHPTAAMGIPIKNFNEFHVLTNTPGIEVAHYADIKFNNAAFWLEERSIHTLSARDYIYLSYYEGPHEDDSVIWQNIHHALTPEHFKVFNDLGLYLRRATERRFRRLLGGLTNLTKTALEDFQGTKGVPLEMQHSPVKQTFHDPWPLSPESGDQHGCVASDHPVGAVSKSTVDSATPVTEQPELTLDSAHTEGSTDLPQRSRAGSTSARQAPHTIAEEDENSDPADYHQRPNRGYWEDLGEKLKATDNASTQAKPTAPPSLPRRQSAPSTADARNVHQPQQRAGSNIEIYGHMPTVFVHNSDDVHASPFNLRGTPNFEYWADLGIDLRSAKQKEVSRASSRQTEARSASVEDVVEESESGERGGVPLIEEIGDRALLMTVDQAASAEQAWVRYGCGGSDRI